MVKGGMDEGEKTQHIIPLYYVVYYTIASSCCIIMDVYAKDME